MSLSYREGRWHTPIAYLGAVFVRLRDVMTRNFVGTPYPSWMACSSHVLKNRTAIWRVSLRKKNASSAFEMAGLGLLCLPVATREG